MSTRRWTGTEGWWRAASSAGTGLPGPPAGTACPLPVVGVDDAPGDWFALVVLGRVRTLSVCAVAAGLGARVVVADGALARWPAQGRAEAALVRPDRVVMDVVPVGGGGFTGGWAPLPRAGAA